MGNSTKNLYQRLNQVMHEVTSVFKGTEVSMGGNRSYSAVSHDDVTRLIHMPLVRNGLFVEIDILESKLTPMETVSEYQGKQQTKTSYLAEVTVQATFVNIDNPDERFAVKGYAYALDSSDKAVGKAASMAVKYIYLKNLLLESTDEEESRDFEKNHKPVSSQSAVGNGNIQVSVTSTKAEAVSAPANRGSFRKNAAPAVAANIPSGDL